MDAFEVVRKLRARQNAILESLPPELLAEYREIEAAIRHIDRLLLEEGAATKIKVPQRLRSLLEHPEGGNRRPSRVPLSQRKMALRTYLLDFGPASRGQILLNTKIPPGTLSLLLTEDEFERGGDGLWRLRTGVQIDK